MVIVQPVTLVLFLGAVQGLFLAVLLVTRRENEVPNRLLAAVLIAFAVFLVEVALYTDSLYRTLPHLIGISQPVIYLFGPLVYLYARTVADGPGALGRRSVVHFLPAAAVVLYFAPFYVSPGPEKIAFVDGILRDGPPLDLEIVEWLKYPHGAAYTVVTFRFLAIYRRRLKSVFSTVDRINLEWLRNILVAAMVTWVVALAGAGLDLAGVDLLGAAANPASLVLVGVVYLIGVLGLRQPEVLWPRLATDPEDAGAGERGPAGVPTPDRSSTLSSSSERGTPTKYRKSGLDPGRAAAIERALLDMMTGERPQEDADLTLQQLARRMRVSPHNLSEVINARLGATFHDFVNRYRVEEAKRRLDDPKLAHQTILAVAIDSGFRSKSTFNKIFKRFTGVTPSEYRRSRVSA